MTRLISLNTAKLALALLSATLVTPAFANPFYGSATGHSAGSYASPRPQDLRGIRIYPVVSQSQNETGKVGLKIWLTEEGTMSEAVVEKSSGFARLDNAAIEYMKANLRYEPAGGQQMPASMHAIVSFTLE